MRPAVGSPKPGAHPLIRPFQSSSQAQRPSKGMDSVAALTWKFLRRGLQALSCSYGGISLFLQSLLSRGWDPGPMQGGRVTSLMGAACRERGKGRRGLAGVPSLPPSLMCLLSSLECWPGVHGVRCPGGRGETPIQVLRAEVPGQQSSVPRHSGARLPTGVVPS